MDIADLTRLIDIDAALASDAGLNYADAAAKHGVTTKTIQRLVMLIRGTGRETVLRNHTGTGHATQHHYAPGSRRLFADDRTPVVVDSDGIRAKRRKVGRPAADDDRIRALRGPDESPVHTMQEIADIVGCGLGTVKRSLDRTR